MNLPRLKHENLLKEKNLWQIYRASRKIKGSKFDVIVFVTSVTFFGTYAALSADVLPLRLTMLKLAEIGVNATACILGFLIAGLTIFGSLTKPELLLNMLRFNHPPSGLSFLKYNFFTLIRTFIYFLVFAVFQLVLIAVGQSGGPGSVLVKLWPDIQPGVYPVVRITFVVSTTLWTIILLELKSFVFNVHHFVFTMIKFDAVKHNETLLTQQDEPEQED